jgi:hypothetical protein
MDKRKGLLCYGVGFRLRSACSLCEKPSSDEEDIEAVHVFLEEDDSSFNQLLPILVTERREFNA